MMMLMCFFSQKGNSSLVSFPLCSFRVCKKYWDSWTRDFQKNHQGKRLFKSSKSKGQILRRNNTWITFTNISILRMPSPFWCYHIRENIEVKNRKPRNHKMSVYLTPYIKIYHYTVKSLSAVEFFYLSTLPINFLHTYRNIMMSSSCMCWARSFWNILLYSYYPESFVIWWIIMYIWVAF